MIDNSWTTRGSIGIGTIILSCTQIDIASDNIHTGTLLLLLVLHIGLLSVFSSLYCQLLDDLSDGAQFSCKKYGLEQLDFELNVTY